MRTPSRRRRTLTGLIAIAALLAVGYGLVEEQLFPSADRGTGGQSQTVLASNTVVSNEAADPAPSDASLAKLTKALANVSGLYDMAVLPDGLGDGSFVVSAMVDVSEANGSVPSASSADETMNRMVDRYFQDVYSVDMPISEAEVTFTEDGTMVGSAGLGKAAYKSLASSAMNGDLASALLSSPMNTNNSAQEEWLEFKPETDVTQ
ncbi:hypothetical protein [Alicyclobacillus acidiphilus]|uniref:hypothetical protein n=1 Tax=Alicyclobacillus acidiphilus TaxID=182455 RepID=UPI000AFEF6C6|nr:hypothetical protein [Alicyclobacillus acidiphilus]